MFATPPLSAQNQQKMSQEQYSEKKNSTERDVQLPQSLEEELRRSDTQGDSKFYEAFLNMLFSLGLLIGVLVAGLWFFKRHFLSKISQGNERSTIKIIEQRTLSPKSTIFILNVMGKSIAIAESSNGITRLTESGILKLTEDQIYGESGKKRSSDET